MKTRIIGDIHGKLTEYTALISDVDRSVQVGDFGVGFAGKNWHDHANKLHESGHHRFIRGNHDDPAKCKQDMVGCIKDCLVENDVMYIGGAWSIDYAYRTEGISWWRDEELSWDELYSAIEVYQTARPRVMITHDCPTSVAAEMFLKESNLRQYTTRTASALQAMFELHQPEFWFFGHWHMTKHCDMNGTRFQCLNELDYVDFDLKNMNY